MVKKILLGVILITLLITPVGCQTAAKANSGIKTPLKIGSLSMITMLPIYVAQREGLFQAQGVDVQIVPFNSVLDRDTALHGNQLDGVVDDIFSGILLDKDEEIIKVVAVSPVESPMFFIIAGNQSNIRNTLDLRNVEVAVSLNTILDYATEKLLISGGLQPTEIKKSSIPSMPLRLEMMNQGKIEAGTFSRPLSDAAVLNGNRVICDDGKQSLLTSSIMFSASTLQNRPDDVTNFLKAWSQATEKISAEPQKYRDLLVTVANIPANVATNIDVPKFDLLRNPTPEEFELKADWLLANGLISKRIDYKTVVSFNYLP